MKGFLVERRAHLSRQLDQARALRDEMLDLESRPHDPDHSAHVAKRRKAEIDIIRAEALLTDIDNQIAAAAHKSRLRTFSGSAEKHVGRWRL